MQSKTICSTVRSRMPPITDNSPSQLRLVRIQAIRTEAERAFAKAQHESLRREVERARRDLDEAKHYLDEPNVNARPHVLDIVDLELQLAHARVRAVADALIEFGPSARMID
jgi:hypothetical protein